MNENEIVVTELRRAEQALRESEERFRLAAQAGRMFAYSWDAATDVIERSGESAKILGIDEVAPLTGRQAIGRVCPDDREGLLTAIAGLSPEKPFLQVTYRIARPDESLIWVERHSRAYFDEHGKIRRIVGMIVDITERKRAEEVLREANSALEEQTALVQAREELLRVFVKNVPAAVAMLDRDMRYLQVSDRWCTDYLPGRTEILGHSHYEIFPDMPERWKDVHRRGLQGETLRANEDRWEGQDGPHWARWEVRPWKTAEGAVGGILVLAEDITRSKQMEEALSGMTRKLIESQEQERARISRELHDDVSQRLAMVAIELTTLQQNNELPSEIRGRMHELQQMTSDISTDVHTLSHELHSSTMEYLGLVNGMQSWCKEFGERQKLDIEFKSDNVPKLPQEISLCLFRVLQEALHNAAKHSGVKRIEVQLTEASDGIHLIVSDPGKGFDIEAAKRSRGLGLTSMQERVRLVGGTIVIDSKPTAGTTIHVCVHFSAERSSQAAAG
jgi:PAS domain S-box-containing protein